MNVKKILFICIVSILSVMLLASCSQKTDKDVTKEQGNNITGLAKESPKKQVNPNLEKQQPSDNFTSNLQPTGENQEQKTVENNNGFCSEPPCAEEAHDKKGTKGKPTKPIAVIDMSPKGEIYETTEISFSSSRSYNPDGSKITRVDWENKKSTYSIGTHTVKLRVKSQRGSWSSWDTVTFKVVEQRPVAVIDIEPKSNILDTTPVTLSSEKSYDPNGNDIVEKEWKNKKEVYPKGQHTAMLRVKNKKGVWSNWEAFTFEVKEAIPVAVIDMTPESNIYPNTEVTFSSDNSYDPSGLTITNVEWENKQTTYPLGTHTVKLRVQNEDGKWSPWQETTFEVTPEPPVAMIDMSPKTDIFDTTEITFSSENSSDPNGLDITNVEWDNKQTTYSVGTHTVKLRVQNSEGTWSDWTEVSFEVKTTPTKPVAVIDMTPETNILNNTEVTFSSENSYDNNGYAIVNEEWDNKLTMYPVGTHTVKLRVQNEYDLWSDWVQVTFEVKAAPPVAVIDMTPETNLFDSTEITFSSENSHDPSGLTIVNEEWENKLTTYPAGTHTVKLRVQNEEDVWSSWTEKTFEVVPEPPVAVIDMTPETNLFDSTEITFSSSNSYDPNGLDIVNEEWENKLTTYPAGTHTVKLRVQNSAGTWSDWIEKTFEVVPEPPIAVIDMTPETELKDDTVLTFSSDNSYDPNGLDIVNEEWENKSSTYPAGTHTVKLRVQNSAGTWSDWIEKTFTVTSSGPDVQFGEIDLYSYHDNNYDFTRLKWYLHKKMVDEVHNCKSSYCMDAPSKFPYSRYDYPMYVEEVQEGLESRYTWEGRKYTESDSYGALHDAIKVYVDSHNISKPSGKVLQGGFRASGTLTDSSGNPLANQEVVLKVLNIEKRVTSDASGYYEFNVQESEIPMSTRTKYVYYSNYNTHYVSPTSLSISVGEVKQSQNVLLRQYYISDYRIYFNLFYKIYSPSYYDPYVYDYYRNIKNTNISLP